MKVEYNNITDKGKDHIENEDDFLVLNNHKKLSYFAIADGVGGLADAKHASHLAIQPLQNITSIPNMKEIYSDANTRIHREGKKKNQVMGSTLVTAIINKEKNKVTIGNVGDSRAYIIDQDSIWHTKDDTLVQELVDMGIFNDQESFNHPNKNRLNKALGIKESVDVSEYQKTLTDTSVLLLCSDGLHDYVRDKDIQSIVLNQDPTSAIQSLIETARKNGSTDDITVILVSNTNQSQ